VIRTRRYKDREDEIAKEAAELLDVFDLKRYAEELPKNLPYGTQRKLEIARALSSHPKLLLLDEPAAGLNSADAKELIRLIRWIHETFDVTIWMIEHHMDVMMELATQIKVIDFGETIAEGTPEQIRNNQAVITAYLGDDNI
jgi:branched-chain amino acid transport system ATP-binding protein